MNKLTKTQKLALRFIATYDAPGASPSNGNQQRTFDSLVRKGLVRRVGGCYMKRWS